MDATSKSGLAYEPDQDDETLPDDLATKLRVLLEKQEIAEVLTRYCRAIDRCDADLMRNIFWPDAVSDHGFLPPLTGDPAEAFINSVHDWFLVTTRTLTNITIEFSGPNKAHVESQVLAYHRIKGTRDRVIAWFGKAYYNRVRDTVDQGIDQDCMFAGRYVDRFEKRGGEWRIAKRTLVMDWNINQPASTIYADGMYQAFQHIGRRDKSDPSYQRD